MGRPIPRIWVPQLHRGALVDWKKVIADLVGAGLSQQEIAAACGVNQSSVSDLARGVTAEPKFEFGSKLQSLHRLRCSAAKAA